MQSFVVLRLSLLLGLTLGLSLAAVPARAEAPCGGDFATWLSGFEQEAAQPGFPSAPSNPPSAA